MGMSGQIHAPTALTLAKNPGTQQIGGWVGPRASLIRFKEEKIFLPLP
jgi:hypothetical protein